MSRGRVSSLEADDRWARVAVSFLLEPKNGRIRELLAAHEGAATLAALRERRAGAAQELYVRLPELDLDGLAGAVRRLGVRVLVPGDPEWPMTVERLRDPPYCLFVRGDPDLGGLTDRSVAVVGARAATDYGLGVAGDLGAGLAEQGWVVVSGAAFGIDGAAHRGCLAGGGPTVAVLACGVDRAYPEAHRSLLGKITEVGAVVSEVPPGAAPFRGRFLARNRLIAALGRATVVVEAGLRSGSLSTANEAEKIARPVGAVPGPVTSVLSAGCHDLVRRAAAVLVTDTAEVVELASAIGEYDEPERRAPRRVTDDLDPVEYAVWSAAPVRRGVGMQRLAVLSGQAEARMARALANLEMLGLVEVSGDGWRKAPGGTGAR
ncbi:DNA-processing protein DprA [Phycicoccus duodecadis]|uniref:DNA processing protein n=1 Tax=Phycicoccus duodecadis TaxID=173053 RepID=A0A2N3YGB3_9MICO|nr:DNA-processing protein DprA [Phycicoccus duodecadis]PKW25860.1 DNA processing protein [Phycicoccus duodecadis]